MWFRRRDRRRRHTPFDASALPEASFLTVPEAVEEGLLLTEYASRMAVKNGLLIRLLSGQESWDPVRGRDLARAALVALADESDTDAENLELLIARLDESSGPGEIQGYTVDDLPNMRHRRDVSREVAGRLRQQSADAAHLGELVGTARRDAWREVASNIERNLDLEHVPVDLDYLEHREDRMRRLVEEDLAALRSRVAEEQVAEKQTAEELAPEDYGAL